MYCGDETGSFIGDIGSSTCRFGYGGEDNPKLVTSASYVNLSSRHVYGSSLSWTSSSSSTSSSMKSILRMPTGLSSSSSSFSLSSLNSNSQDNNNSVVRPITDPNEFLRQGDMIEDWDALEVAWETSMDTLHARDTKKHTIGGMSYSSNKSTTSSTTISSTTTNNNEHQRCSHPILAVMPGMTEICPPPSNDDTSGGSYGRQYVKAQIRTQYERYTELLMESDSIRASSCFLAPSAMLSSFSVGRQTALVVDIGAGGCRVTPVCDGLVLKHSQRRNGRGGDWLDNVLWNAMQLHNGAVGDSEPKPRYLLRYEQQQSRDTTDTSATTSNKPKTKTPKISSTSSPSSQSSSPQASSVVPGVFHARAMRDLMFEIRTESFVKLQSSSEDATRRIPFVSLNGNENDDDEDDDDDDGDDEEDDNNSNTMTTYQLPDGTSIDLTTSFGRDVKQLPELLFTESSNLPFRSTTTTTTSASNGFLTLSDVPLHRLVHQSLLSVSDVDVRKELAQSVVVVGGASQWYNVESRLSYELSQLLPSFVKPKVIAPVRFGVERSCASWIGASILTSLGSFQQLWLSKAEYDEYGVNAIQRFPQ